MGATLVDAFKVQQICAFCAAVQSPKIDQIAVKEAERGQVSMKKLLTTALSEKHLSVSQVVSFKRHNSEKNKAEQRILGKGFHVPISVSKYSFNSSIPFEMGSLSAF